MLNEAFQVAKCLMRPSKWQKLKKNKAPIFPKMTGEKINTIFTVRGREKNKYEIKVAF